MRIATTAHPVRSHPSAFTPMCFIPAVIALFLMCAASPLQAEESATIRPRKEIMGEYYIRPPEPPKPETVKSLRSYTDHLLSEVFVAPKDLYNPPIKGTEGFFHDQVTPHKAMPLLAGNVETTTGQLEGLAVGLKDGRIFVYSKYPCRQLAMPEGEKPSIIAWGRNSPNLIAVNNDKTAAYRFNLESCPKFPDEVLGARDRGVQNMIMSDEGAWLVFTDAQGTIWYGPPEGLLEPVVRMKKPPMFIGFTPGQGMLVIVEDTGKVIFRILREKRELNSFTIPGGPFEKAEMDGLVLYLTDAEGQEKGWKLLVRGPEPHDQPKKRLFVQNGKLWFSTGLVRWQKKRRMLAPELLMSWSRSASAVRVRDLDKETRYYSWPEGEYLGQDEITAKDWQLVSMTTNGRWIAGSVPFRLADPVYQRGTQRLMCRYIPEKGFFLWWRAMPKAMNADPRPMHLPMRADIRDATPPVWHDLNTGHLP